MLHQISSLADSGDLVGAFNVAFALEGFSQGFAQQVGKWESDLLGRAGRWVLALTLAKEFLTMLATAGAGELIAGAKAAKSGPGESLPRSTSSSSVLVPQIFPTTSRTREGSSRSKAWSARRTALCPIQ